MKRYQIIFLAAAAFIALAAGVLFDRPWASVRPPGAQPGESSGTASSSLPDLDPSVVSAVSPDALAITEPAPTAADSRPFQAGASAAMDLMTGDLLYQYRADARWPVASLTKLMTAVVVLERMDLEEVIALAPADFAGGGSNITASLQPGDRYRAGDLLRIMLVPSSNEAAEAFARTYGRQSFTAAMNSRAALWGLRSTHFDDPSGLSAANQSTPREFLELVRRIHLEHPEILSMTRDPGVAVAELGSGALKYFPTTNNFALSGRADFLGGKTGTTPAAGGNLASAFMLNGRPVGTVVFDAADRWSATLSLLQFIR